MARTPCEHLTLQILRFLIRWQTGTAGVSLKAEVRRARLLILSDRPFDIRGISEADIIAGVILSSRAYRRTFDFRRRIAGRNHSRAKKKVAPIEASTAFTAWLYFD